MILLILILIDYSSNIVTGKYAFTKRLNNGMYVIASSTNIKFVDSTFTIVINSKNFESEQLPSDSDCLGSTTKSQFSSDHGGYVIVVLAFKLYIFTSIGEYLMKHLLR